MNHTGNYRANPSGGKNRRIGRCADLIFSTHKVRSPGSLILEKVGHFEIIITESSFRYYSFFTYLSCFGCYSIREITVTSLNFFFFYGLKKLELCQAQSGNQLMKETYIGGLYTSSIHRGIIRIFKIRVSDCTFSCIHNLSTRHCKQVRENCFFTTHLKKNLFRVTAALIFCLKNC